MPRRRLATRKLPLIPLPRANSRRPVGVRDWPVRSGTRASSPIGGARVTVPYAGAFAEAALDGTSRMTGPPTGTRRIDVIMIRYPPLRLAADLRPDQVVTLDPILRERTPTLDSVTAYSAPTRDDVGFDARGKNGLGHFCQGSAGTSERSDERSGRPVHGASDAWRRSAWTRWMPTGRLIDSLLLQGDLGRVGSLLDDVLPFADVGGIKVYSNPADAPAQFGSSGDRPD